MFSSRKGFADLSFDLNGLLFNIFHSLCLSQRLQNVQFTMADLMKWDCRVDWEAKRQIFWKCWSKVLVTDNLHWTGQCNSVTTWGYLSITPASSRIVLTRQRDCRLARHLWCYNIRDYIKYRKKEKGMLKNFDDSTRILEAVVYNLQETFERWRRKDDGILIRNIDDFTGIDSNRVETAGV